VLLQQNGKNLEGSSLKADLAAVVMQLVGDEINGEGVESDKRPRCGG
jgi:hypothetical protein